MLEEKRAGSSCRVWMKRKVANDEDEYMRVCAMGTVCEGRVVRC